MRSRILLIVILLTVGHPSLYSQDATQVLGAYSPHAYRDFSVSASPNLIFNTPNGTQLAGGLKLRMFAGKRFSFDSEFLAGRDFVQFGPGLIGIPIWLLAFSGDNDGGEYSLSDLAVMAALVLLSTEHFSYHIPVNSSMDLSPYVSLLRLENTYRRGKLPEPDMNEFQAGFGVGLELNKYFNRFLLSPYIEYNRAYSTRAPGFNAGVYFGYYFYTRK